MDSGEEAGGGLLIPGFLSGVLTTDPELDGLRK